MKDLYAQDPFELAEDSIYRTRLPYPGIMEQPIFENRMPFEDPYESYDNDMAMEPSKISLYREGMRCDVNLKERACPDNERCLQYEKARFGICDCKIGFVRNKRMMCVPDEKFDESPDAKLSEEVLRMKGEERIPMKLKTGAEVQHLSVSVLSKSIELPENKAVLAAYPVPDEDTSGVSYNYTWTLISQPANDVNGTISGKTKKNIELQNLSEGVYKFKVVVSGQGWLGEAFANVTVLPKRRFNKAPLVRITPEQQIIKEPTNMAILDGSTSKVSVRTHRISRFIHYSI